MTFILSLMKVFTVKTNFVFKFNLLFLGRYENNAYRETY